MFLVTLLIRFWPVSLWRGFWCLEWCEFHQGWRHHMGQRHYWPSKLEKNWKRIPETKVCCSVNFSNVTVDCLHELCAAKIWAFLPNLFQSKSHFDLNILIRQGHTRSCFGLFLTSLGYNGSNWLCGRSVAFWESTGNISWNLVIYNYTCNSLMLKVRHLLQLWKNPKTLKLKLRKYVMMCKNIDCESCNWLLLVI